MDTNPRATLMANPAYVEMPDGCQVATPNRGCAESILRAVNCHDDLVAIAEAFKSYLEDDSRSPRRRQACLEGVNAALAKTRGEAT